MALLPTNKTQLERLLAARGWGRTLAPRPSGAAITVYFSPAAAGGVTTAVLRATAQALEAPHPGGVAAWVDGADALDPASAARAGVPLDRLLWLRAGGAPLAELLTLTQMLVAAARFRAVALDVRWRPPAELERWPQAAWFRWLRALERHRRSQLWVLAPAALPAPSAVAKVAV
ncbi:MAG: hypothetical protein ACRD2E_09100 [Terriglobales bacterium]